MDELASGRESGLASFKTNVRAAMKLAGGSRNSDTALPFESNFRAITHPFFLVMATLHVATGALLWITQSQPTLSRR
jgi:hypothetical protein